MSKQLQKRQVLLVGDNPFHGISHLSQERNRVRGSESTLPERAADLIITSFKNGANGFMFSVSETTLSILKGICGRRQNHPLELYAILPYAYEYVRLANQVGGIPGLAKMIIKRVVFSRNLRAFAKGLKGIASTDPKSLIESYLYYELSRINSSIDRSVSLRSVLLHQLVTDIALALDMEWLFKLHIDLMSKKAIIPGFNTGNYVYLVEKLRKWNIDLAKLVIAAPFNKAGFQMMPNKAECEQTLKDAKERNLIAISVLGAGYLDPLEAFAYLSTLPNLKGVAVGVSKDAHARQTFRLLAKKLTY